MATQNGAQHQPKISPGPALHRSISTPAPATTSGRLGGVQQQQQVQMNALVESQQRAGAVAGNTNQRVLIRSMSRTEAVKE